MSAYTAAFITGLLTGVPIGGAVMLITLMHFITKGRK